MDRGVARPGWAEHAGAVVAAECYVNTDAFGDRDEVICVFSYAGREEHALVVVVDYNAGGMITDGWVTSQVGKLLGYCQNLASRTGRAARSAGSTPPDARRLLESALIVTETIAEPAVSTSFPSYHAFIRARIRTLPPAQASAIRARQPRSPPSRHGALRYRARPHRQHRLCRIRRSHAATDPARRHSSHGARRPWPLPASHGTDRPGAPAGGSWRRDRRAMLVAEFLASDEAEDLSDIKAASRCADHIVDYGCDQDFGRPLRVSPAKAETFLLDWLPRKIMLIPAEQHAMPHVLVAWARWAGAKSGLDQRSYRQDARCRVRRHADIHQGLPGPRLVRPSARPRRAAPARP